MRYPNLRYGNPTEMAYYSAGMTPAQLAHKLRRDERTVRDWLNGKKRVPWWVPEVLRLQHMERAELYRQHMARTSNFQPLRRPLAVVTHAGQLELRRPDAKKPHPITELRLSEFDQVKLVTSA